MSRRGTAAMRSASPDAWVWLLAVALVAVGATVQISFLARHEPAFVAPFGLRWWAVAAMFFAAEVLVVHLPARKSTYTISLSEVALVFGLVFAAPLDLIVGRLVGGAAALAFHRRQPPLKLGFNCASFYAELVAALAVLAIVEPADLTSMAGWGAIMGGVVAATTVGVGSVTAAISIFDPTTRIRTNIKQMSSGTGISLAVGLVSTTWAMMVWVNTSTWPLVVASGVGIYGATRVFGNLYHRYDELDTLHGFATTIGAGSSVEAVVDRMLATTASRLTVPSVTVALCDRDHGEFTVWRAGVDEPATCTTIDETLTTLLASLAECRHVSACLCTPEVLRLDGPGIGVPIMVDDLPVGILVVSERERPLDPLGLADRKMLVTMARQFGSIVVRIEFADQLQAQLAEKQRLIESKDQLIASVSHEVRTPLTAVLGFAEIMRDDIRAFTREELEAIATSIATESTELSYIVEDLLTAARADLDRLAAHTRTVEVLSEARRAVAHMNGPDEEPVPVEGEPASASADPNRLRQIVRNLAANAFRHGAPPVRVRVDRVGEKVLVQVIDHGPGAPVGAEDRIFEPYESAGGAESQPSSLGLGLAIARDLARLMGGELTYRRDADTTIFQLELAAVAAPVTYISEARLSA